MAKILIGVTGGIAAYKACSIVSYLVTKKHEVKVIMTPAATQFVGTVTFQALSKNHVYVDMFDIKDPHAVEHIDLAQWADVMLIAPATANTISKLAYGNCDNLLTTVCTALPKATPVLIAPAMNTNMWEHPVTQHNMEIITNLYNVVPPASGVLACGDIGIGKLADNKTIICNLEAILKTKGKLHEIA